MRATTLMAGLALIALAGCWEDEEETGGDDTAALGEELPADVAGVEETAPLTDAEAAALAAARAEGEEIAAARQEIADQVRALRAEAEASLSLARAERATQAALRAARRAELAAQEAEARLAALADETTAEVEMEIPEGPLAPFLGAWAIDPTAEAPDWVLGRDALIWSRGACALGTVQEEGTSVRVELTGCEGGDANRIVAFEPADPGIRVLTPDGPFELTRVE
ncbi:hypothetical protein [Pontivivens ytuae]|uniref:Uncharacterized protein n=1 Tax=Pontivivens ytuae TaxID=2789856 RepID=A0A7S9LT24_9RHOB|nr:hypothetical protein [Pontivivens ytuae]QPH54764.1 hypothetical protein I0K15_03015 [Pontivivens ytuae]